MCLNGWDSHADAYATMCTLGDCQMDAVLVPHMPQLRQVSADDMIEYSYPFLTIVSSKQKYNICLFKDYHSYCNDSSL